MYIYRGSGRQEKQQEVENMKLIGLAICSLGIWVFLSAFVTGKWVGIVFGAIAAVLALIGSFMDKK